MRINTKFETQRGDLGLIAADLGSGRSGNLVRNVRTAGAALIISP